MDDLAHWLRLTGTPGLGPSAQRALLTAFGLPERIFAASRSSVASVVGRDVAARLDTPLDQARLDTTTRWLEQADNHIVTLADEHYPQTLLNITDPPVLLYVCGNPSALSLHPALAMVGSRNATPQGTENARDFARSLAEAGLTIASGLALGIDTAAHEGALAAEGGCTVAFIGTGADRVYPARNRKLAHAIVRNGAIVSEYPLGTPPLPHNFPRRNRLLAGLARGVLVVEATLNSGSLITARLAVESGREVFAIPGSIHSAMSRGCHRLIRDGAKLVETAQDVLEELRLDSYASQNPTSPTDALPAALENTDPETRSVMLAMGHDPVDIDTLSSRCGLTVDTLYAILLTLELTGTVSRLPGGRFQRN